MAWAVPWFCFVYLSTSVVLKVSRDWVLPFFLFSIRDISWARRFEYFAPFLDGWVHSFFPIFFLSFSSPSTASFRAFPTTVGEISSFLVLVLFFNQEKKKEKGKRRERYVKKRRKKKQKEKRLCGSLLEPFVHV